MHVGWGGKNVPFMVIPTPRHVPRHGEQAMIGRTLWVAAVGAGLAGLAGCVSYANYPPVPKDTAFNDPNIPALESVMMAGLQWATTRYPPGPEGTPFAINLPEGVKPAVYRRVARSLGEAAQPLTAENSHLPIYHVGEMRVRGDQANIWIYRPVVALGTSPQGTPVYQEVKLWLRGGLQPWQVVNAVDRAPGASEIPPLNYYEPEPPPVVRPSRDEDPTYKPPPRPKAEPAPSEPPAGEPAPEAQPQG